MHSGAKDTVSHTHKNSCLGQRSRGESYTPGIVQCLLFRPVPPRFPRPRPQPTPRSVTPRDLSESGHTLLSGGVPEPSLKGHVWPVDLVRCLFPSPLTRNGLRDPGSPVQGRGGRCVTVVVSLFRVRTLYTTPGTPTTDERYVPETSEREAVRFGSENRE